MKPKGLIKLGPAGRSERYDAAAARHAVSNREEVPATAIALLVAYLGTRNVSWLSWNISISSHLRADIRARGDAAATAFATQIAAELGLSYRRLLEALEAPYLRPEFRLRSAAPEPLPAANKLTTSSFFSSF